MSITASIRTMGVIAGFLLAPATLLARELVVNYQMPDGSEMQIDLGVRFPSTVQQLAANVALKPGVPILHKDSALHGKIASQVKGNKLIIWQALPDHEGKRQVRRAVIRQLPGAKGVTPDWWPHLSQPWARRAVDQHSVTTTLMGWSNQSVAKVRNQMLSVARRAGLSVSKHTGDQSGNRRHTSEDGDLLFFTGSGKELMLTLSRIGHRTGVVAHYTEVKQ